MCKYGIVLEILKGLASCKNVYLSAEKGRFMAGYMLESGMHNIPGNLEDSESGELSSWRDQKDKNPSGSIPTRRAFSVGGWVW